MAQKALLPLLLLCFLQLHSISGESLQEIIVNIEPVLQQLRYKVRTSAATANVRLTIASAYVSNRISTSSRNITQQLSSLQETVQQVAENEGVQVCTVGEQAAASTIDTDAYSSCRCNKQIADIDGKIVFLKGLLAEIDQLVTACLVDSQVETEALKACLQRSVDGINCSLRDQERVIGNGIDEAITGADKCVSEVTEELEEKIVAVAKDFLSCVGSTEEGEMVEIEPEEHGNDSDNGSDSGSDDDDDDDDDDSGSDED